MTDDQLAEMREDLVASKEDVGWATAINLIDEVLRWRRDAPHHSPHHSLPPKPECRTAKAED